MRSDTPLGTELAGYRIESVIGRGGMSVVYLAEQLALRRKVALKILASNLAEDERFRERFVRESRLAAGMEHPNIIPVYEAGEAGGLLYLAMRYVRGTDLKALIKDQGALPPERTVAILSQVASALDAAHGERLVHRDVKPGNILISQPPGGTEHVYLSDFGLTKRTSSESGITGTGQFVGTLDYAAPEQFEGRTLDGRTDVYSLGCVLYECLTGEVPYKREQEAAIMYAHLLSGPPRPSERRPELPPGIDQVVAKAMAKAPADRYVTAGELMGAARTELGVPTGEHPLVVPGAAAPWSRLTRKGWLAVGAGAAVLVGVVVALALVLTGGSSNQAPRPTGIGAVRLTGDSLAHVDPKTGKLLADVPVGRSPIDVAIGAGAAWVANQSDGTVTRIDLKTGRAQTIGVGRQPSAIAVENSSLRKNAGGAGTTVWVIGSSAESLDGTLTPIDTTTNEAGTSITVGPGLSDVAAAENSVWVAGDRLYRIDTAQRVAATANFSGDAPADAPFSVGVGEGSVWVASSSTGLFKYEPTTLKPLGAFRIGPYVPSFISSEVAVGDGGIWITRKAENTVYRVDPATDTLTAQIKVGSEPTGIVAADGAVWVANSGDGTITRIDPGSNKVVQTIKLGGFPQALAVAPDGSLWVVVPAPL